MKKSRPIEWSPKKVLLADVLPTPKNYKIKTELGQKRLQESLAQYGLAGTMVVNPTKVKGVMKYPLIDGNSRREQEIEKGSKWAWVSVPNRMLTPKEFNEMSAMFDFAKAGEVDMDRIQGDLGTSKDFYDKWGIEVPLALLDKMGNNAIVQGLEFPDQKPNGKKGAKNQPAVVQVTDIRMVQLFFSEKQEAEFRKMEELLKARWGVNNTTETVFKAFKELLKKK